MAVRFNHGSQPTRHLLGSAANPRNDIWAFAIAASNGSVLLHEVKVNGVYSEASALKAIRKPRQ